MNSILLTFSEDMRKKAIFHLGLLRDGDIWVYSEEKLTFILTRLLIFGAIVEVKHVTPEKLDIIVLSADGIIDVKGTDFNIHNSTPDNKGE